MKTNDNKDDFVLTGNHKVSYYNSRPLRPGNMSFENLPRLCDVLDGSTPQKRRNDIDFLNESYRKLMSGDVTLGVEAMLYDLDRKRFKSLLIKKGFDVDAIQAAKYERKKAYNRRYMKEYMRERRNG